jgi:hemolysin-activating ACP:hemolysin acyltransferase
MHVIFKRGEDAAHVTINCCGALCIIVVLCNETQWQQGYFVFVHDLWVAVLGHVLCMKERMVSQMAANRNMCTVMLHKCRAGYKKVT